MISAPAQNGCLYQDVFPEQQCLYLFPLPHGHGSFRLAFIAYPAFSQEMRTNSKYKRARNRLHADPKREVLPVEKGGVSWARWSSTARFTRRPLA